MKTTPRELFNERVPNGLKEKPELAQEMGLLIQFNISGDQGGEWTVDTIADPPTCLPGNREDVQCTITLTDEALIELIAADRIARPNVFMKHVMEGTAEIDGDALQAMKLSKVFAISETEDEASAQ